MIPLVNSYATWLERDVVPKASGKFEIGAANLSRRYLAEELIDTPLDQMVAIGQRELLKSQAEFRAAANVLAPGKDPQAVWLAVRRDHPPLGGVVAATRKVVDSLTAFVASRGIASLPTGERVVVAPALPFDLGFASMHASPPLEPVPVKSVFYITDARADLTPAQQEEWLRALQLRVALQHRGARGDARALAALHLHAADAGQGASHLDRAESVSAALVGAGRLGALRGADGARRRFWRSRSAAAGSRS